MIEDYWREFAVSVMTAGLFFTLLGVALATRVLQGFPALARWLLSPLLGLGVWTGFSVGFFHLLPFHRTTVLWVVAATSIVALALAFRVRLRTLFAALPFILLAAALTLLPLATITPSVRDGALIFPEPIFDHMKVALVDAALRHGLPPVSPFYAVQGEPTALNYYYGWHVVAAMVKALSGASGLATDGAMTYFTAFVSLLGLGGLAAWITGARRAAYLAMLGAVPLGLEKGLQWAFGTPYERLISREHGMEGWLRQAAWCPQHLFAGSMVVLALLLSTVLMTTSRGRWWVSTVLGLVVSAAVVTSIWAGVFGLLGTSVLAPLAIGSSRTARQQLRRWIAPMLSAVAVAVIAALPVICQLGQLNSKVNETRVSFWIYPTLEGVAPRGFWWVLVHIGLFWIAYMLVQFGAVYVAGWLGLLSRRVPQQPSVLKLFHRLSLAAVVGDLLVALLSHSVIINNDLGWRVVIPPLMLLLVWAAVAVTDWLRSLEHCASPMQKRVDLGRLLAVTVLGTIGLGHSARFVMQGLWRGDVTDTELLRDFRRQPQAWRTVRALTAPHDIVAVNPTAFEDVTEWTANAPMSLFADRATLVSDTSTPLVFGHHMNAFRFHSDLGFLIRFFNKT
ncbi:hypothetical protein ACFL5O_03640, partial [Myxococcota bacterium]